MNDMSAVIIPKSDQINADDLISGPMTVTIEAVSISPGTEQPVSIKLRGIDRVYRPCKTMSRALVAAWGADSRTYAGRSMTIYNDPTVKWGGMAVGGIRISHMSDINSTMSLALMATKGKKSVTTIKPLAAERPAPTRAPEQHNPETGELPPTDKAQQWADTTLAAIAATDSRAALAELQQRSAKAMQKLSAERPELSHRVSMAFVERVNAFDEPATLEPADDDAPF